MIRRVAAMAVGLLVLAGRAVAQEAPRVEIVEPTADTLAVGRSLIRARVDAPGVGVRSVTFFVDGRLACTVAAPPWECAFDAGTTPSARHVRVVARLDGDTRAVANVRTRALGFTESVRVNAVQVPVIVRDGDGRFLGGLAAPDFLVKEDGVPQALTQAAGENVPLDLVLAIDISGSMESVMADVARASTRFVDRLRPQDSATVLAFNDNRFVVVDTERDPLVRRTALARLEPWGGTALYDAVAESLDLAARSPGRKGVVIFSDGEDRASRVTSEDTIRRVQQSDAMVYTIAFGVGASQPAIRRQLEEYAKASGGRVFFPRSIEELDKAFAEIIEELSSQYLLSYEPAAGGAKGWRRLEVDVARRGARVRAREGYLATAP